VTGDPVDELLAAAVAAIIARNRQPWWADALCREHPELAWFPGRGEPNAPAKAVCARCLVRDECLADALAHDLEGVRGGTSTAERRRLTASPAGDTEAA